MATVSFIWYFFPILQTEMRYQTLVVYVEVFDVLSKEQPRRKNTGNTVLLLLNSSLKFTLELPLQYATNISSLHIPQLCIFLSLLQNVVMAWFQTYKLDGYTEPGSKDCSTRSTGYRVYGRCPNQSACKDPSFKGGSYRVLVPCLFLPNVEDLKS